MTQLTKVQREAVYEEAIDAGLLIINEWTGHSADQRLRSRLEKFAIGILKRKEEFNEERTDN